MSLYFLLAFQIDAKYEVEREQEVRLWMEAVIGEPLDDVRRLYCIYVERR